MYHWHFHASFPVIVAYLAAGGYYRERHAGIQCAAANCRLCDSKKKKLTYIHTILKRLAFIRWAVYRNQDYLGHEEHVPISALVLEAPDVRVFDGESVHAVHPAGARRQNDFKSVDVSPSSAYVHQ